MKTVKISITVPEPLLEFAEKKARQRGKEREERPNVSAVFKDLLLQERNRETSKPPDGGQGRGEHL